MRLGSIASAPFLGSQFASLYQVAVRVPTVPGEPTIASAIFAASPPQTNVTFSAPSNNGGSAVTGYKFYFDGVEQTPFVITSAAQFSGDYSSQVCRVAAVNAVGEGPKSSPVTVV